MKIFYILIILLFLNFSSSIAVAETKQDCSIYNNDSLMGMLDKRRCEQGKPPRKKLNIGEKLKKLNPLDKN